MRLEWDGPKAEANRAKHGISFDKLEAVFTDPLIFRDHSHSEDEDRFVALGNDEKGRLLSVIFTRPDAETIRIISARKATGRETEIYAESLRLRSERRDGQN